MELEADVSYDRREMKRARGCVALIGGSQMNRNLISVKSGLVAGILVMAMAGSVIIGCGGEPRGRVMPQPVEPAVETAAATDTGTPQPEEPAPVAVASGPVRITGVVKFAGTAPKMPPIQMGADPICAARHKSAITSEALVLGADNAMANVFVYVKGGLPAKAWPAPATPVVLDQSGCQYKPHVFGMMVGQKLVVKNPDGTLHNVHALSKVNPEFNMAMPKTRTEAEKIFDKPESMFSIKCDVHPWMGGYAAVMEHPFFAVSGMNGQFEIRGDLPAGTYEIEAWHEKLGTQIAKVTVPVSGSVSQDFSFAKP